MGIPKSIQKANEESDKLIAQIGSDSEDEQAAHEQHLDNLLNESTDNGQGQIGLPGDAPDTGDDEGQSAAPPEGGSDPDDGGANDREAGDWKRKFDEAQAEIERLVHANTVLKGKYNAEVPELSRQVREMREQLAAMQQSAPEGNTDDARQALLDELSPEAVQALERMVSSRQPGPDGLSRKDLDELREELRANSERSKLTALKSAVPEFDQIEGPERAKWTKFLQQMVPGTGRERNYFLQEAYRQGDIERCAGFYRDYIKERDSQKPPRREEPPIDTSGQPASTAPRSQPRRYKRSEMNALQAELAKGRNSRFNTHEKRLQAQQLLEEMSKADIEGRMDHHL